MKKTIKGILLVAAIIVGGYMIYRIVETNINRNNAQKVKVGMTKEQVKSIMGEPDEEFVTNDNIRNPGYLYRTFPHYPMYEPVIIFFKDSTFIVEQVRTGRKSRKGNPFF
jgi:SmpA / OmlA family